MSNHSILSFTLAVTLAASATSAQLLGGGGLTGGSGGGLGSGLDQTIGGVTNSIDQSLNGLNGLTGPLGVPLAKLEQSVEPSLDRVGLPEQLSSASSAQLIDLRRARLNALVNANRTTLDRDGGGQPVRRGELIVANPDDASLQIAARAGFGRIKDEQIGDLGIRIVTLSLPRGMNVRQALKTLRKAAPGLDADYNHIFEPAGGVLAPAVGASLAAVSPFRPGTRIAMIDGGVAAHSSLAMASIDQRGFAGPAQPTGHGTAVGSLLVGSAGNFRGAAPGAQLFVADVYGGNPAAGSATTIIRALAWAASKRPAVINVSLVGPRNAAMERAVSVLRSRGIALVAAVGNDGPAAPPQYPASYPGVIAVTGVDANDRALREAGHSTHLDFAAPGADLVAASPGKGYAVVRGTSFAAPLVAARLAAAGSSARLALEAVPGKGRVGQGIVCKPCRIAPKAVGLK